MNHFLLSALILLPLLGAACILLLPRQGHQWIRALAFAASSLEFLLSLLLLRHFNLAPGAGYQFVEFHPWIATPPIHYHLGLDGISLFLVLLTTFLLPVSILASFSGIHSRVKEFFFMLLLLEAAMIGAFLALDLFLFFLFWEAMLIPMYFLIGIWGHDRKIYAALKFILYTMLGSILMLVAILWLFRLTGSLDLPVILHSFQSGAVAFRSWRTEALLFGAFFLSFAIKVPLFPFHTWLPDAHTEAPTAGSVILAGVMLKMGAYGMLRFCLPLFPEASHYFAPLIGILAIIGIIYGALVALVQSNLKRLVAYSSVSHLGFVVLGIFAFDKISIEGSLFQMLSHGVSTGMLFLVVGMLYERRHTFEISQFGGLATPMPVLMSFFLFACLSSLALPLLNGFVGEFLILLGVYGTHPLWVAFATTGSVLSASYLLWAYQRVALQEVTVEVNSSLPDATGRERLILATLALLSLFMGLASPLFTRRMDDSTSSLLFQMQVGHSFLARGQSAPPPLALLPSRLLTLSRKGAPQAVALAQPR